MMDQDQIARAKIRNDIHSNYFVEAGAGSGKTSVLVDRMVSMVEGGIDISKICAITFTKAAAGEFYARFQSALYRSKTPAAQKALKDIDLCFMGTIDSFCNMVLSEHPSAARIPSDASVLDADSMESRYLREYSNIIRGEYGEDLKKKAVRFASSFYNAKDVFISGLVFLMNSRNANFNYVQPPAEGPDVFFMSRKEGLLIILSFLKAHPEALSTDSNKAAAASCDALMHDSAVIFDDWDGNTANVLSALTKLKDLRILKEYEGNMDMLGPGWENYFAPHISRGKTAWYEFNPDTDPLLLEAINGYQFSVAADFLHSCVGPIADALRAEGDLSFFDYLLYLRDLLKEDAAKDGRLIDHIYDRHSYFLIDEFQDTNPLQAEVFFYLTAKEPKENWKECVPKAGSLFIVGDPKQSIYRFRNADVGSYLKVKELFKGEVGEVLCLTRNFRSTDVMCSWFNEVFTKLLPTDTATQSRFNPIPTGEKPEVKASLSGAYCYSIAINEKNALEPDVVAGMIRKIIDDPSYTVQDRGENKAPRRVEYKDIMLITPAKTRLSDFMAAFHDFGIPFKVEGKVMFEDCPALRAVSYVLSAAADRYDRKARFAALNMSGLDLNEDCLVSYYEKGRTLTPAAMFSLILDEQKVFARAGAYNAENLYFALELLRAAESAGKITSLKDGADFISSLINEPSSQERCIQLLRDSNRVHIANLHKVKGLEAPVVILADPRSKSSAPESSVDYTGQTPQSYLFRIGNVASTDFDAQKDLEQQVLDEEDIRLLYVAATRAANAIIMGSLIKKDGEISDMCPWKPLLEFTHKAFPVDDIKIRETAEADHVAALHLYDEAAAQSALSNAASFAKSYEIIRPSQVKIKGVTDAEDDYGELTESERRSSKKNPALIGTMVHRMMEVLVNSRGKADLSALISETLKEYEADDPYYRSILSDAGRVMLPGGYDQKGSVPKDILKELLSAEEVYCELPFCFKEDETHVWHGIMDVVYKKDDLRHIVDYKTNADGSDLDAKYQAQLAAYIKAFEQMTGRSADARTYHIAV